MFPHYSDTSTHNDVLLSLDYYGSATCCFNDTLRITNHCTLRTTAKSFVTHMKLEEQSTYSGFQRWCEYRDSLWGQAREPQVWFCLGNTHRVYWLSNTALENSPSRAWNCELSYKRKKELLKYPLQYLIDSNQLNGITEGKYHRHI